MRGKTVKGEEMGVFSVGDLGGKAMMDCWGKV